jgi:phosphoribosylaminoimidazolecarboxamide formyltransferase/IMP cyclohydrolase
MSQHGDEIIRVKRALLSVSDKRGLVELAKHLRNMGVDILSTGGTAKALMEAGIQVFEVAQVTGFPEMLEGRVKTLHPRIHGGILARRDREDHLQQLQKQGIVPIDLVVVNLYPFESTVARPDVTLEQAIENIDIGGPSLIRAAAKNHQSVVIVVNPEDYSTIRQEMTEKGGISQTTSSRLALEAFERTSQYDQAIAAYLRKQ